MHIKLSAYWWCQVAGWGTFVLIASFFYFNVTSLTDFPNYYSILVTALLGLITSHLMRSFIIRTNLLNLNLAKQVVAIVLTTVLFAVVYFIFQLLAESLFYTRTDYPPKFDFWEEAYTSLFLNAQFLGVWNLIYFIHHYIQKSRNHLIERIRLESELKIQQLENENTKLQFQRNLADVSLTALRSQMNPHFIFNCLNSIKLYTEKGNTERASEYLDRFSVLIRLVMEHSTKEKVLLSSELDMLHLYIEMEAMRFKEKLQYNIQVEKNVETDYAELPPLLLQPYVENAIWHGLMHKEEGGKIDINVAMINDNSLLQISIADNGVGRAKSAELKKKKAIKHESYGMKVTSERIALINQVYKIGAEVQIDDLIDTNGNSMGTKVIIQIPV